MLHTLEIHTRRKEELIDITRSVMEQLQKKNIRHGIAVIYSPHTTAGVTINENADPDVRHDVLMQLDEVFPWKHSNYRHMEGNSAAHLKAILTGASQTVPIEEGKLVLGRWQGIYFCEFDGPRHRTCHIKIISD